jgi:hypothetical protein
MEEAAKEHFADIECHPTDTHVLYFTVDRTTNLTGVTTPADRRLRTAAWRYLSLCID